MPSSGMLHHVALLRTRIGELGTMLVVTISVHQLLVTVNVVTLMMETIRSS
jgi:hypothetical protein